ncbi:High affinity iron permease ftrA [Penicillium diatomitis]|uniref:High affinity iron permease ftrA n=1 Tax=Penicillium diatomitis TaxID=2819901 RepID=A0A9W9XCM6_9EURO|nr:High affinity iron permease ftrA [Penicillium diatomitis]KAJ5488841.1 High affinity iron permease ftrA [Penicillium diatomitis]
MGANPVFAVTVFFILFRECLETTVVVSVLLAFLKQTLGAEEDNTVYKKLVRQVWLGCALGIAICLAVGAGMIGAFYGLGTDTFSATEDIWEGVLGIVAAIIITIMGAALLRVSKIQEKWRLKLAKALNHDKNPDESSGGRIKRWSEKYVMFMLPFITVLREGLEAVIYVGGVGLGLPASSFPLAVFCGLLAGFIVGYIIYRGGRETSMQIFLIVSTCFLYLVAAGLFSRGVWFLENNTWNHLVGGDSAETGSGPGSYDIGQSVWHVNCCNPLIGGGGGWGIFNALFGWTNSATVGSVLAYNFYWIVVIVGYSLMMWRERHGPLPYLDPAVAKIARAKARAKAFVFRTKWDQPDLDEPVTAGSSRVERDNLEAGVLHSEKGAGAAVSNVTRP